MLEQLVIGLVSSLIANAATTIAMCGFGKFRDKAELHKNVRDFLEGNNTVNSALTQALTIIGQRAEFVDDPANSALLQIFFESPTTESIVRQMLCDSLTSESHHQSKDDILEEFTISLATHIGTTTASSLGRDLFDAIMIGCSQALDYAMESNILSAHDSKNTARFRIVLDEFRAVNENLEFLRSREAFDANSVDEFETQYRAQVGHRHRTITIHQFDQATPVELASIFVDPRFEAGTGLAGPESTVLSLQELYSGLYRFVVLGDPGGGKSTLAQKICFDLSEHYQERLVGGRLLTPVMVVLRDYSARKALEGCSILQFIESESTAKYQLPEPPPHGVFEYLVRSGRILVIFDGLDELIDPALRREIRSDVEAFCNLFTSVPVLVTSRLVGYEQAPLDTELFESVRLTSFDDNQVSEYATNWFTHVDTTSTQEEAQQRTEAFMAESKIVMDLRSNPLMLALMCALYRGSGFIPRNRPEVFQKCAEMLFERWDPMRGIWSSLPISEPRRLLGHLAQWIYSDETFQSGVREGALIRRSTDFLFPMRYEIEEEAERAATEFIAWCRGRAWVFTEAGTTQDGVSLFKFTHQTFLEYFAALDLVRNNRDPDRLWNFLGPKIAQRSWDVVAQLSIQLLHEGAEGASDEFLMLLLDAAAADSEHRWAYLDFGARCLQFTYPSTAVIRNLTVACLKYSLQQASDAHPFFDPALDPNRHRKDAPLIVSSRQLWWSLLSCALENRTSVANTLSRELVEICKTRNDQYSWHAASLGLALGHASGRSFDTQSEAFQFWNEISKAIGEQIEGELADWKSRSFLMFRHSRLQGAELIDSLFEWYSPDHLFFRQFIAPFETYLFGSIADTVIRSNCLSEMVCLPGTKIRIELGVSEASRIWTTLRGKDLPWFFRESVPRESFVSNQLEDILSRPKSAFPDDDVISGNLATQLLNTVSTTPEAVMGTFVLVAVFAEIRDEARDLDYSTEGKVAPALAAAVSSRSNGTAYADVLARFQELSVSDADVEFIRGWLGREINLVGQAPYQIEMKTN